MFVNNPHPLSDANIFDSLATQKVENQAWDVDLKHHILASKDSYGFTQRGQNLKDIINIAIGDLDKIQVNLKIDTVDTIQAKIDRLSQVKTKLEIKVHHYTKRYFFHLFSRRGVKKAYHGKEGLEAKIDSKISELKQLKKIRSRAGPNHTKALQSARDGLRNTPSDQGKQNSLRLALTTFVEVLPTDQKISATDMAEAIISGLTLLKLDKNNDAKLTSTAIKHFIDNYHNSDEAYNLLKNWLNIFPEHKQVLSQLSSQDDNVMELRNRLS